jgi:hypothetical protein
MTHHHHHRQTTTVARHARTRPSQESDRNNRSNRERPRSVAASSSLGWRRESP